MRLFLALIPALMLVGCTAEPAATAPQPPPTPPATAPKPNPVVATAPLPTDWQDWPLTPGTWALRKDERGTIALFGAAGVDAVFMVRCDLATRQVYLSRNGAIGNGAVMTIRTSSALKAFPALPAGDNPPYAAARLAPREPQLDAIAFSRGRYVVSVTGLPDLVLPSWPEFTRVVEDCRG